MTTIKLYITEPLKTSELITTVQKRDIRNTMLQLNSEIGEMNDWINRPHRQKEHFSGECADAIICIIDALYLHAKIESNGNITKEEIIKNLEQQLVKKTKKWRDQVIPDLL